MPAKSILKRPREEDRPAAGASKAKKVAQEPVAPVLAPDSSESESGSDDEEDSEEDSQDDDEMEDEFDVDAEDSDDEEGSGDDEDDEDAIRDMLDPSKPAKKIKHKTLRPVDPSEFGAALSHLLALPASTSSLKPLQGQAPPSARTEKREKALAAAVRERRAGHYERGHVKDVISGWGPRLNLPFSQWDSESARSFAKAKNGGVGVESTESSAEREKRLKRLAQRGVVRLFNAIGAAQGTALSAQEAAAKEKLETVRKDGEKALVDGEDVPRTMLKRPNVLGGKGKGEAIAHLSKASFLDLIRSGA